MDRARSFFAEGLEREIEDAALAAVARGGRVSGMTAGWHLFLQPLAALCGDYLFRGAFIRGYAGWRESVNAAALVFAVNARVYEILNGDRSEAEKIKAEFPGTPRD